MTTPVEELLEKLEAEVTVWKARSLTLRRMIVAKDQECSAALRTLEVVKRDMTLWRQIAKNTLDATGHIVQWCPECLAVRNAPMAERVDGHNTLGKLCPKCLATVDNPWETPSK
jgi:hypothetical protein